MKLLLSLVKLIVGCIWMVFLAIGVLLFEVWFLIERLISKPKANLCDCKDPCIVDLECMKCGKEVE